MALTDQLEAFWPLTADSIDATGNGFDGTDTSVTHGTDGALFGSGSVISTPTLNLQLADIAFSISFEWKSLASNAGLRQTVIGNTGPRKAICTIDDGSTLERTRYEHFIWGNGQSPQTYLIGVFHRALFTYSTTSDWKWYVDGVLVASGNTANFVASSLVTIGQADGGDQRLGYLRNIGCWSRELSGSEAVELDLDPNPIVPPAPPVVPTLALNGIVVSSIMALEEPVGERRDIGDESMGSDGSLRITRQTRKRDLKFKTIPLSAADAHAWESLFIGEGETWSFNSSLYGSKGSGPSANVSCSQQTASSKFGTGRLYVQDLVGSISFAVASNIYGTNTDWTVSVWRSIDGAFSWTNTLVRSDGAKWIDGVRDDAATTTWLSVTAGVVTIANTSGTSFLCDDLVVLPYKVLDSWPEVIGIAARAFSPLPYFEASGLMVTEQEYRTVIGSVTEAYTKTAGSFKSKLSVTLRAK